MTVFQELKRRGLIAQTTNEEAIERRSAKGRSPSISALTQRLTACMSAICFSFSLSSGCRWQGICRSSFSEPVLQ